MNVQRADSDDDRSSWLDALGIVREAAVATIHEGGRMRSVWPLFLVLVVGEQIRSLALVRFARSRR
ncbi:MAG: hypothetical protein JWM95_169 [Gemmatimonadetes bacterium]|nr:hypothetical protein [Gemmatimonadota bacterium]